MYCMGQNVPSFFVLPICSGGGVGVSGTETRIMNTRISKAGYLGWSKSFGKFWFRPPPKQPTQTFLVL